MSPGATPEPEIVALDGELDISRRDDLTAALEALERRDVVLDLTEVSYLDSTVVAALLRAQRAAAGGGRRLVLVARGRSRDALALMGIHLVIPVHPDRSSALASLGPGEPAPDPI